MKKRFVLALTLLIGLFGSCNLFTEAAGNNTKAGMKIVVCAPQSPPAIPILRMIATNALRGKAQLDLKLYSSMEEVLAIATHTTTDYRILALPVNTAVTLYNKGFAIKLLNVSVWGGMYLSAMDSDFRKWEDLRGKRLYVPAKGSVPDVLTNFFLQKHGVKKDEVEIVYSNHAEIAQLLAAGKAKYVIDAEPFVTANKENIQNYRVICNFVAEWKRSEGKKYDMPNFGAVASGKLLVKSKLLKSFNKTYRKALRWTIANPQAAGELARKYLNANGKLIENAMPNFNFAFKTASESRVDIKKYCQVLLGAKPASIGGKIPDEKFYFESK
jgi:NitT/TauT family transport system substrate-binding protein